MHYDRSRYMHANAYLKRLRTYKYDHFIDHNEIYWFSFAGFFIIAGGMAGFYLEKKKKPELERI